MFICPIYAQETDNYYRFLDSADYYSNDAEKVLRFLDSIPKPLENFISDSLADYYIMKSFAYGDLNNDSQSFQTMSLALKYAEEDKDYSRCAYLNLNLFYISFDVFENWKENTQKYLEKTKYFRGFLGEDYDFIDLFIEQGNAYYHAMNDEYEVSNTILLNHLDECKTYFNDYGILYMDANQQISLNYISLGDIDKAHKHFRLFKTSKNDSTIRLVSYRSFESQINLGFAKHHYKQSHKDSSSFYLSKVKGNALYMDDPHIIDYYKLCSDVHKENNDLELSKSYLDSLVEFQNKMTEYNVMAGDEITTKMVSKDEEIISIKKKSSIYTIIGILIILPLLFTGLFYFSRYKKGKNKLSRFETQKRDISYFKVNNEKLSAKVQGLESYIKNLKNEVKNIASVKCLEHQKLKIKELYTNLHINSSTILDKGESHLELINDLNIDFFKKISVLYPQLNKSEVIICYYVLIGFTNKEIAVFLNTSIRSVESKRYRISKKMDFNKTQITLSQHLQKTFKYTLQETMIID